MLFQKEKNHLVQTLQLVQLQVVMVKTQRVQSFNTICAILNSNNCNQPVAQVFVVQNKSQILVLHKLYNIN